MLNHLKLLAKIEELQKEVNPDFDFLSDIDILKSFNLPISLELEDVHAGTLIYRLLSSRTGRPSTELWGNLIGFTKGVNAEDPAHMAAEIYFDVLVNTTEQIYTPASNGELSKEAQQWNLEYFSKEGWSKITVEPGKYPPRDDTRPSDAMPNITGGMSDVQGGTFLSKGAFGSTEAAIEAIEKAHGDPVEVKDKREDGDMVVVCEEHDKEWYITHEGRVYEYWHPPPEALEKMYEEECKK